MLFVPAQVDCTAIGDRTDKMCLGAQLYIALPGGKGSLLEILYMHQLQQADPSVKAYKFYLYRDPWEEMIKSVFGILQKYLKMVKFDEFFHFVDSYEEIIADLKKILRPDLNKE